MLSSKVILAAALQAIIATAYPAQRRDGASVSIDAAMSAGFASMFAEGNLVALEHSDGSTNENLVIEKMLYSINAIRYMHDAPPVKWNQSLQNYATNAANKCIGKHSGGPYGENLYLGGNNCAFAMEGDIEEKAWDAKGNPVPTDVDGLLSSGHFFQTIWKDLKTFGCGRVWCGEDSDNGQGGPINNWIWFCEFDTWSSIEGFAGNVSKRTHDSVPAGWDVPENHVSFTSFPPIESPALSFPTTVSYLTGVKPITEAGMYMSALPPDVLASATGPSGFGIVPTAVAARTSNGPGARTTTPLIASAHSPEATSPKMLASGQASNRPQDNCTDTSTRTTGIPAGITNTLPLPTTLPLEVEVKVPLTTETHIYLDSASSEAVQTITLYTFKESYQFFTNPSPVTKPGEAHTPAPSPTEATTLPLEFQVHVPLTTETFVSLDSASSAAVVTKTIYTVEPSFEFFTNPVSPTASRNTNTTSHPSPLPTQATTPPVEVPVTVAWTTESYWSAGSGDVPVPAVMTLYSVAHSHDGFGSQVVGLTSKAMSIATPSMKTVTDIAGAKSTVWVTEDHTEFVTDVKTVTDLAAEATSGAGVAY